MCQCVCVWGEMGGGLLGVGLASLYTLPNQHPRGSWLLITSVLPSLFILSGGRGGAAGAREAQPAPVAGEKLSGACGALLAVLGAPCSTCLSAWLGLLQCYLEPPIALFFSQSLIVHWNMRQRADRRASPCMKRSVHSGRALPGIRSARRSSASSKANYGISAWVAWAWRWVLQLMF
jgi:hypothetical protein